MGYWLAGVACSLVAFLCEFMAAFIENVRGMGMRSSRWSGTNFWTPAERIIAGEGWRKILKWIAEEDLIVEVLWKLALLALVWPWATWLALRFFRPLTRRAGYRAGDEVRACLYSFDATPAGVMAVAGCSLLASVSRNIDGRNDSRDAVANWVVAIVAMFYVMAVAKLIFALHDYLKVRWALMIGLATQAMVLAAWFGGNELWTRSWYGGGRP